MKKLLGFRGEFADAQLAYLRALRNTGVTLRQFTESESLEVENNSYGLSLHLPPSPPPTLPPSPPPTLPPSPQPPPPFSPDLRKSEIVHKNELVYEGDEIHGRNEATTPPPLPNSWNLWNPFESLELDSRPNGDLKSSLPNVFQALTALANVFANGFESVHGQTATVVSEASQDSDVSQP